MSRVIAAPVAGKALTVHGADVIWITSPNLPDLPDLDRDVGRGRRTVQLDIKQPEQKAKLLARASKNSRRLPPGPPTRQSGFPRPIDCGASQNQPASDCGKSISLWKRRAVV
ncbi:hypothetical protein K504DRAFT_496524 [Pleomassaria siparia CBS 279.74]|uniref:Uncharacterized protein n=1 Tax=Pleomassaria siparia CBS 279.74 TaxID=1314801 RepID=A0A6G1KQD4_9PLEO|nr:hypothetical protein K504DRAFT_496524 [Pleomassaria siparia CBS 279.74]